MVTANARDVIDAWQSRGRQVECLNRSLFVVEAGDPSAPALLLIHGFPTSGWDWHRILDALSAHFYVLVPDMLGFGLSDKPQGHRYTMAEQADLLEALLAQRGIDRFHLLAHDYGDTVAQELLARDCERHDDARCLSVALLNGGLFPEATRPRLVQKLLLSPLGGLVVRFLQRSTLERNMHAIYGPETPPSSMEIDVFWALIERNGGRTVFHRLIRYMAERDRFRERWLSGLRNTRAPILLINGGADPISGAHLVARYRELISDQGIVELPDIGHYPQLEAADEVTAHYLAFVSSLGVVNT
ncbi:MAG: alpha/beta fold hydrolase [Gammaproteobacteria bacterium]